MKTRELVELVNQGVKPVIRVIRGTDLDGPDNGMLGRITSVGIEDIWDRENSTVEFVIDFKEFEEINIPFAWMESRGYEKDSKSFSLFEMLRENQQDANLVMIELVEENKWLTEYLKTDKKLSYTQFLESKLDLYQVYLKKFVTKNGGFNPPSIFIFMKQIILTQQEIWMATRYNVQKSKKIYYRKNKHKKLNSFES